MRTALALLMQLVWSGCVLAAEAVVLDAPIRFADRVLRDLDGRPVRFKGDVVGAGPAVISFTYTGCRSICPTSDLVMNALESLAEKRKLQDLKLVTLTIDPGTDTPERLAVHARELDAGPGRLWLTGELPSMIDVLDGLGMRFGRLDAHDFFFVVVDARGRRFKRIPGNAATAELLLRAVAALR